MGRADRRDEKKAAAEGKNWKTDLSGGIQRVCMMKHGCHPSATPRRARVVWNFPDGVPQHREPLYTPRPDLVDEVPDARRQEGVLAPADAVQDGAAEAIKDKVAKKFPLILT